MFLSDVTVRSPPTPLKKAGLFHSRLGNWVFWEQGAGEKGERSIFSNN